MGRTSNADERLMTAALDLMWEESYGAVTIDDICQRAGVKKGSFYYFYDSKSALAVACLDRMSQSQRPIWDEQFSPATPALDRIRARCEFTYQKQVELKAKHGKVLGCPLCSVGSEICNQDEQIRDKIREIWNLKVKYWESAIRDAQIEGLIAPGDAVTKARCAFAYYEGLITQARIHNDVELLRNMGDLVLEHLHAKQGTPAVRS